MNLESKVALVLMGLVMVCVFPAGAQDKPADNMQIVVEKIRADKKLFIADNMKLTDAWTSAWGDVSPLRIRTNSDNPRAVE